MEENSVMQPRLYPPDSQSTNSGTGGHGERCGTKVHRTLEPEGNLEIPLLKPPLDSQENRAQTGEGRVRITE